MERSQERLITVSLLYLLNAAAGAAIAIRHDLKAAFPGFYTGKPARQDFVTGSGTALSPSLTLMIWQLIAVGMALGGGRVRQWGLRALTLNGALFAIGMLGEPITYQRHHTVAVTPIVVNNILFPLLMLIHGMRVVQVRRKR